MTECWIWAGRASVAGYGLITIGSMTEQAHRLVYESITGENIEGLDLHHVCHNKLCINPGHLHAVKASDHMRSHFSNSLESGHRFGSVAKSGSKWQAVVCIQGKMRHIATFATELEAREASLSAKLFLAS